MRSILLLMIPTLFLSSCAGSHPEGRAAAILDVAQQPATDHAASLTGDDIDAMRRTGLRLIRVVRCWVEECP